MVHGNKEIGPQLCDFCIALLQRKEGVVCANHLHRGAKLLQPVLGGPGHSEVCVLFQRGALAARPHGAGVRVAVAGIQQHLHTRQRLIRLCASGGRRLQHHLHGVAAV